MRSGDPRPFGFTLVELIIVMTLLAVVAAWTAPAMSRSIRARNLRDEAARFLAATEYARDEAVSLGLPMTVWIDPETQRFGVAPKAGFTSETTRSREFAVHPDIHFEMDQAAGRDRETPAVEFAPDGAPGTANVETLRLVDRFASSLTIVRTKDGWAYEIQKEAK